MTQAAIWGPDLPSSWLAEPSSDGVTIFKGCLTSTWFWGACIGNGNGWRGLVCGRFGKWIGGLGKASVAAFVVRTRGKRNITLFMQLVFGIIDGSE